MIASNVGHEATSDEPSSERPVINALWIGELSPLERLCMASFVRQGHAYHLHCYEPIANVPEGVILQDAAKTLPAGSVFRNARGKGKGSFACFSDLFRYKLLLEQGGWWVDTDVFCLRRFDFAAPYVFGAEDKPVATGIIKLPRGSALAERCYDRSRRVDHAQVVWNELCDIFADGVRELDLMRYVLPPHVFSPIAWYEVPDYVAGQRVFTPSEGSYAVHLYNEMWRRNKLDKFADYGPQSVIEILKRHSGLAAETGRSAARRRKPASWFTRWLPRLAWNA